MATLSMKNKTSTTTPTQVQIVFELDRVIKLGKETSDYRQLLSSLKHMVSKGFITKEASLDAQQEVEEFLNPKYSHRREKSIVSRDKSRETRNYGGSYSGGHYDNDGGSGLQESY